MGKGAATHRKADKTTIRARAGTKRTISRAAAAAIRNLHITSSNTINNKASSISNTVVMGISQVEDLINDSRASPPNAQQVQARRLLRELSLSLS